MANNRAQVRAIVKELRNVTARLITKITLDLDANLRESTPIDTGWARANWVPAIGTPHLENLEGIDPKSVDVSAAQQKAANGKARVLGYKLVKGKVFVTNNVPYISRLNAGSSKQAPAGFVQRAIAKAVTVDIKGFKG